MAKNQNNTPPPYNPELCQNNQNNTPPPYNPEVFQDNQPIYNLNTQPQQQTYFYNPDSGYSSLLPNTQPQNNPNNQQQSGYYNPNRNYSPNTQPQNDTQPQNNTNNQRNFHNNNNSGNYSRLYDTNTSPFPENAGSPSYQQSRSQAHCSNTQSNQTSNHSRLKSTKSVKCHSFICAFGKGISFVEKCIFYPTITIGALLVCGGALFSLLVGPALFITAYNWSVISLMASAIRVVGACALFITAYNCAVGMDDCKHAEKLENKKDNVHTNDSRQFN